MDFKDQIKQLSERVAKLKENIGTEEATKTAFIMPFIQALGYDVFDWGQTGCIIVSCIGTSRVNLGQMLHGITSK